MAWLVLRPREMETFRNCRRAWDFGARIRQNYVPITPAQPFDFDKAVHDALAVYYFPAMDDWNRSIVRPLAVQGFHRAMAQDRKIYEATAVYTPDQEADYDEHLALGEVLLDHYFDWAATVDDFDSIFSDQEFWVPVPDPWNPGLELSVTGGRPLRYLGRIDHLISDPADEYWIVDHRLVRGGWEDTDQLLLDTDGLSFIWAMEIAYPQLKVAGTIYNELRTDGHDHVQGTTTSSSSEDRAREHEERDKRDMTGARRINLRRSPGTPMEGELSHVSQGNGGVHQADRIIGQHGNDLFRRTQIRRGRRSIESIGVQMAIQTEEMKDPDTRIFANPTPANCSQCPFRRPCIAMFNGYDPEPILAAHYRKRSEEEFEEERLRWSIARQGTLPGEGGKASKPDNARFTWG